MKFLPLTDFGLKSRDKLFNKKFKKTQINPKSRQNAAQYHISLLGNFGVFSFMRS